MTEAEIQEIIIRNKPLCITIAKQLEIPGVERDDLIQEGQIALFDAIRYHNADRCPFPQYAGLVIRRRMRRFLGKRSEKPYNQFAEGADELVADPRNRAILSP